MKYLVKYGGLNISNEEQNNDSKNTILLNNILESNKFNPENGDNLLDTFYNLKKIFIENKKFANNFYYDYQLTEKDINSIINNITDFNYIDIYKKIVINYYDKIVINYYDKINYGNPELVNDEYVIDSLIGTNNLKKNIIKFFINYIYWERDDIIKNYNAFNDLDEKEKKKFLKQFNEYNNSDIKMRDFKKDLPTNTMTGSGKKGRLEKKEKTDNIKNDNIAFRKRLFEINIEEFFNSNIENIDYEKKIELIKFFQKNYENEPHDNNYLNSLVKQYLGLIDLRNNYAIDFLKKIESYFNIEIDPNQEDTIDFPNIKKNIFKDEFKISNFDITFKEYKKKLKEFKKYETLFDMIYILILNYHFNNVDSIYIFNIIKYFNDKENDSDLFDILYLFKDYIFIEKLDENYKKIIYDELNKFKQIIESEKTRTATTLEQIQIPTTTNLEQTQITTTPTTTNLEQTQITTTPTFLRTLGEIFYNNISYKLVLLEIINNFFENIRELEIEDNKNEEIYYNDGNLRNMNDILEKRTKNLNIKYNLSENKFNNFEFEWNLDNLFSYVDNIDRHYKEKYDQLNINPKLFKIIENQKNISKIINNDINIDKSFFFPTYHVDRFKDYNKYLGKLEENTKNTEKYLLAKLNKKYFNLKYTILNNNFFISKIIYFNYLSIINESIDNFIKFMYDEVQINFYFSSFKGYELDKNNKIEINEDQPLSINQFKQDILNIDDDSKINERFTNLISTMFDKINYYNILSSTTGPVDSNIHANEEDLINYYYKLISILYYYIGFFGLNLYIKYLLDNDKLDLVFKIFHLFEKTNNELKNSEEIKDMKIYNLKKEFVDIFEKKIINLDVNGETIFEYLYNHFNLFITLGQFKRVAELLDITLVKSPNSLSNLSNDIGNILNYLIESNDEAFNLEVTKYLLEDKIAKKINFLFLNYSSKMNIFLLRRFFYQLNLIYKNSFILLRKFYYEIFSSELELFNYDFIFENLNKLKEEKLWVNSIKAIIYECLNENREDLKKDMILDNEIFEIFLIFLGLELKSDKAYEFVNAIGKNMIKYEEVYNNESKEHQKRLLIKCFNIYYLKFNKELFKLLNDNFDFINFKTIFENNNLNYDDINFILNQKELIKEEKKKLVIERNLAKNQKKGKGKGKGKEKEIIEELSEELDEKKKVIYLNYKNNYYKILYKQNYLEINYIEYKIEDVEKVIQTINNRKYNYVKYGPNNLIKEYYIDIRDEYIDYNNHIDYIHDNANYIVYGTKHNNIENELFYINDYYQNESQQNSNKKYNNINYLYKNNNELIGKGFLKFKNCKFFGDYLLKENEFLLDGYFYEIHNSDRMMEKNKIKIEIKASIENFKLMIFNEIPDFEINLDSEDNGSIKNKINENNALDNDKILSSLKIKFKQTNFNTEDDFKRYLENIFKIKTDNKITKTLIKKYGIKITRNNNRNIEKINNIITSIDESRYDVRKLFNNQEFELKYKNFEDFQKMIMKNFEDNEKDYMDIAANILLFKNITILDCMNIFHNHDYKETLKNISNLKNLSNYERLEKLKEFNIDINQQTIPQNSSNVEVNQQTQLQTIPNKSLVVYVYQGSNFDRHIYYEWDKENNSLWIEVSCLYNGLNCHIQFDKNPMDDFFIIYFCSIFNNFTKSSNNNSNLIIYSKDNFSEWNIEKNDNITINDYNKPNNKIIIKQNRNENTLYRDVTRGNTNNLEEEIKTLFLKLQAERYELTEEEIKLVINNDLLYKLSQNDEIFSFINESIYDINYYIEKLKYQYLLALQSPNPKIVILIYDHINYYLQYFINNFQEIYMEFKNVNSSQIGRGRIYKISYNI